MDLLKRISSRYPFGQVGKLAGIIPGAQIGEITAPSVNKETHIKTENSFNHFSQVKASKR